MKVVIVASLVVAAYAAACGKLDGSTAADSADCECGDADNKCAKDTTFCLSTAPTGKRCLPAKLCAKVDGSTAVPDGESCSCGDSTAENKCAEKTFCRSSATDKLRCMPAKVCASTDGSTENADACSCGDSTAEDKCAEKKFCDAAAAAKSRCLDAKKEAAVACESTDGSTAVAEGKANCKCGDEDDADKCAKDKFCDKSADKTKRCLDAKKEATAAVACESTDGSTAVAEAKANCKCGDEDDADKCAKDKFCDKSADKTKRCLDAKKEATAVTTKAATTKAAAVTTAGTFNEATVKAAHAAAKKLVDARTKADAEAALTAAGAAPAGVTLDKATLTVATGVMKATVKFDSDPNAMSTADKLKTDTFFCTTGMSIPVDMCDATYKANRRLDGRNLAAADYNVEIKMKTEDAYVKEKKAAAGAAQKTLTSGASAFGIAIAIGLVALY